MSVRHALAGEMPQHFQPVTGHLKPAAGQLVDQRRIDLREQLRIELNAQIANLARGDVAQMVVIVAAAVVARRAVAVGQLGRQPRLPTRASSAL